MSRKVTRLLNAPEKLPVFRKSTARELLDVNIPALRTSLERESKALLKKYRADASDGKLKGTNSWYEISYKTFKDLGAPRSHSDFLQRIAFAYSWLATIPKCRPDKQVFKKIEKVEKQVEALQAENPLMEEEVVAIEKMQERWDARAELVTLIQAALRISTKRSIVAVSKVLHFWNPDAAPMIDANVVLGLGSLPKATRKGMIGARLLGHVGITKYLWYWELAFRLGQDQAGVEGLEYRELDLQLFLLGQERKRLKQIAKKRIKS